MKSFTFLMPVLCSALAACGGSSTSSFIAINGSVTQSGTSVSPDNVSGALPASINVTANGTTYNLPRTPSLDLGDFAAYQTAATDTILMTNRTDYSAATLGYVLPMGGPAIGVLYGATSTNNGLATSGSATYTGDYAGLIGGAGGFILQRTSGDASLTADFTAGTVTGDIKNRQMVGLFNNTPFNVNGVDVTFGSLTIGSDGRVSGSATGGHLNAAGWLPASGTVDATFAGPASEDFVGRVTLNQNIGGTPYTEFGGFVTSQ